MNLAEKQCPTCGVHYALDAGHAASLKERKGASWHCPNGHSISYVRTEVDELREEVERLNRSLANMGQQYNYKVDQILGYERRIAALKGVITKLKNK